MGAPKLVKTIKRRIFEMVFGTAATPTEPLPWAGKGHLLFWRRTDFHKFHYLRHNSRRLEHLATLQLPIRGKTVLEVGAGLGDHTTFFRDRGCSVTISDARESNLRVARRRYLGIETLNLDLNRPVIDLRRMFDVVCAYGVLYHLHRPDAALDFLSRVCREILLLETIVSRGHEDEVSYVPERAWLESQSVSGYGCRPTRAWVFNRLRDRFEHVYVPCTQPCHEEFPLNWAVESRSASPSRTVFIASRTPLNNPQLSEELLMNQERCS